MTGGTTWQFRLARLLALMVLSWLPALITPGTVHAQTTVVVRSFDEPLAPYGNWVDDPTYGRVWRPSDIGSDWRPYTVGRWVYTSEYGWVWVSDERWGWVVYHYGRWVLTSQYGWVWVAGTDWAPAWVEWCSGGGYIGWTPMPPQPYWQADYYYGSYDCASPAYYSRAVYVQQDRFAGASVAAFVVTPALNARIAGQTTNVTSYRRSGTAIVNRSVDVAKLAAATGRQIAPLKVVRSQTPVAFGASLSASQTLRIYQPPNLATARPRPDAKSAVKGKLDPAPGRNPADVPVTLGAPATYPGNLPSTSPSGTLPGGIGGDGPSIPSAGGNGGLPGPAGSIGGGLLGGRRR